MAKQLKPKAITDDQISAYDKITCWDIVQKYDCLGLTFRYMRFNSTNTDCFNIFAGYGRNLLDTSYDDICKDEDVKSILDFLNSAIEDGNRQDVVDYLLNWCAYFIQNPGSMNRVAIAITGRQGSGKSTLDGW